jgi:hypothetical protein
MVFALGVLVLCFCWHKYCTSSKQTSKRYSGTFQCTEQQTLPGFPVAGGPNKRRTKLNIMVLIVEVIPLVPVKVHTSIKSKHCAKDMKMFHSPWPSMLPRVWNMRPFRRRQHTHPLRRARDVCVDGAWTGAYSKHGLWEYNTLKHRSSNFQLCRPLLGGVISL